MTAQIVDRTAVTTMGMREAALHLRAAGILRAGGTSPTRAALTRALAILAASEPGWRSPTDGLRIEACPARWADQTYAATAGLTNWAGWPGERWHRTTYPWALLAVTAALDDLAAGRGLPPAETAALP